MRLLLLLGLLVVVGCRPAPIEDQSALVLKTYDVPKGTARQIVASLKDILWMGDQKLAGRAVVMPDGRLGVLAPPNVQTGVQTLVDEVKAHPPTYDQSIEIHYFLVSGKPSAAPSPPPAGAAEIQPALDEIVRSQGAQSFSLLQHARLTTQNGEDGNVDADKLKVWQKASETEEGVTALVGMIFFTTADRPLKIETRVSLAGDRVVVLGSAGDHEGTPDAGTLYYVVRLAPRAGGPKP